jgi:hypothetical protein
VAKQKIAGFSNAVHGTQPGEGKVSLAEVKYSAFLHLVGLAQRHRL